MPFILHIETSTKVCSVSLSKNNQQIDVKEIKEENYSHSENLNRLIRNLLEDQNIEFNELDAISISEGPGSYTGLRIGTSTAKGLCFALDIPLISIPTLEILAYQFSNIKFDYIIPMIDARRMEVYYSIFNKNIMLEENTNFIEVNDKSFENYHNKKVVFVGNGAFKMKLFTPSNWMVIENSEISSSGMIKIALKKFVDNDFVDTAYFEPFYLKKFQAGIKKKFF